MRWGSYLPGGGAAPRPADPVAQGRHRHLPRFLPSSHALNSIGWPCSLGLNGSLGSLGTLGLQAAPFPPSVPMSEFLLAISQDSCVFLNPKWGQFHGHVTYAIIQDPELKRVLPLV